MRIALPCKVDDRKGPVDDIFGGSRSFAIYDTESDEWDFVVCEVCVGGGNQEILMAERLMESGVSVVITGEIGPEVENHITNLGIEIIRNKYGKIEDIVEEFKIYGRNLAKS